MLIKDLEVGMKFYVWSIGFGRPTSEESVPVEMRKFFQTYTIEKVNKVTFVANGEKMSEIPSDWKPFDLDRMKNLVILRAKRYFANVDSFGAMLCGYYRKSYTQYLETLSEEEKADFGKSVEMLVKVRLKAKMDDAIELANSKVQLALGLREPNWDER
ncbi:MAG: hypothetical protein ACRDDH_11825 [Cetobacterium sp.]|uniref:hypothetical protein n=1 Tax=Cetobacterium sp. TaxID=2071632 RepID=UPI003EE624F5